MNNSIFIFTDDGRETQIVRFHICTWEFRDSSALFELGCEIDWNSIKGNSTFSIEFYIPWLKDGQCFDLYKSLKDPQNSKFIFNDSITNTRYIQGGDHAGVIHEFFDQKKALCVVPLEIKIHDTNFIRVNINVAPLAAEPGESNVYFRFYIKTLAEKISIRKNGLNKSTILYDLRINEMRNLPENLKGRFQKNKFRIESCFCLHIVPNDYEFVLKDPALKSIRTLEAESFKRYIGAENFRDEELVVMFNKKSSAENYSFFSIFNKEIISTGQFAFAASVNLLCALLLYVPYIRGFCFDKTKVPHLSDRIPAEFVIAALLLILYMLYLLSKIPVRAFITSKIPKCAVKSDSK